MTASRTEVWEECTKFIINQVADEDEHLGEVKNTYFVSAVLENNKKILLFRLDEDEIKGMGGAWRSFNITVRYATSNDENSVLVTFNRKFKPTNGCCCGSGSAVTVYNSSEKEMGEVQQQLSMMNSTYRIKPNGDVDEMKIEGRSACWLKCLACLYRYDTYEIFKIKDNKGNCIGEMGREFTGHDTSTSETNQTADSDRFTVTLNKKISAYQKTLLLGAVICIDFDLFEDNVKSKVDTDHI